MKKLFVKALKIILGILLVGIVAVGFLYINNDIGTHESDLISDIRSSQKIKDDWIVDGMASDTLAAYISYAQDKSDYTYSVYVNRTGLSLGYFFRSGGSIAEIDKYIAAFTSEGYSERAFISMNAQKVDRLEIDDGNSIHVIDIDSSNPFAIVLPVNADNIVFYDVDGNVVDYINRSL